jgi:hypothetical protein
MVDGAASSGGHWLTVSEADYLWFVDQALDEMVDIVRLLGPERANLRPALESANSPYAILTHCLGVLEYWGGSVVAEREISRDREAEFRAEGQLDALFERVAAARRTWSEDLAGFHALAASPQMRPDKRAGFPGATTKGGVLLHVLRELLQHHGQMEISRDLLLAPG